MINARLRFSVAGLTRDRFLLLATPEMCAMIKKYARLGIWILENMQQLEQAAALGADVIETTGSIKPV